MVFRQLTSFLSSASTSGGGSAPPSSSAPVAHIRHQVAASVLILKLALDEFVPLLPLADVTPSSPPSSPTPGDARSSAGSTGQLGDQDLARSLINDCLAFHEKILAALAPDKATDGDDLVPALAALLAGVSCFKDYTGSIDQALGLLTYGLRRDRTLHARLAERKDKLISAARYKTWDESGRGAAKAKDVALLIAYTLVAPVTRLAHLRDWLEGHRKHISEVLQQDKDAKKKPKKGDPEPPKAAPPPRVTWDAETRKQRTKCADMIGRFSTFCKQQLDLAPWLELMDMIDLHSRLDDSPVLFPFLSSRRLAHRGVFKVRATEPGQQAQSQQKKRETCLVLLFNDYLLVTTPSHPIGLFGLASSNSCRLKTMVALPFSGLHFYPPGEVLDVIPGATADPSTITRLPTSNHLSLQSGNVVVELTAETPAEKYGLVAQLVTRLPALVTRDSDPIGFLFKQALKFCYGEAGDKAGPTTQGKHAHNLQPEDYSDKPTVTVVNGYGDTEGTLTEFAPNVFAALRKLFEIDQKRFVTRLTEDGGLSFRKSPGRSGSSMYFACDASLIVKTMTNAELRFLQQLLPAYVEYLRTNPESLISRILGLYKLTPKTGRPVNLFVMESVFHPDVPIHEVYDLKGSSQNRAAERTKRFGVGAVYKDTDFVTWKGHISLGEAWAKGGNGKASKSSANKKNELVHSQAQKDSAFLRKHGVMDYSLLVGVHYFSGPGGIRSRVEAELKSGSNLSFSTFRSAFGGAPADDGSALYFIGVIDILQEYDVKKKTESAVKGLVFEKSTISAVDPQLYMRRFAEFVYRVFS